MNRNRINKPIQNMPSERVLRQERVIRLQRAVQRMRGENAQRPPLDYRFTRQETWKMPKPAPGVVPPEAKMAMDSAIDGYGEWAMNQSIFEEGQAFLGYPYLSELSQRPEYRVISETWAQEMTRKWIKLVYTGDNEEQDDAKTDKLQALEKAMKTFKVQEHFRKMAELDGFFGRAHLYIDLGIDSNDREELASPIGNTHDRLSRAKIKKGSLKRFKVIEPIWTYPNAYNSNDPLRDDFFTPATWFVMGKQIHSTRLLTFVGRPVPDLLKPMYSFGGLALSQICKPYVDNWLRTRQSVSDAISNFSIMILMTDMSTMLNDGAMMELATRADLFNVARDNRGLMLADKNSEDLKNVSMPLGTLDHLQAQSQEHMSSVSQIPLVKLTGISPSGLNATSEQEVQVFDDKVEAQQEAFFRENLVKVINVLQLHLWGEVDPSIGFEFEKLYGMTEEEETNRFKTQVDADVALINAGVIDPQESRVRLASDPDSPYASLDTSEEALPNAPQEPGQETDEEGALSDLLKGGQGGQQQPAQQKPQQQNTVQRKRIAPAGGSASAVTSRPTAPGKPTAAPVAHDADPYHDDHGRFTSHGTVSPSKGTVHFHDWGEWKDADDKDTSNSMYKYGMQAHRVRTCSTCGQKQYEVGAHDEMLVIDEAPANIEVHRAALGGPEPKLRAAGILYSDGSHILLLRRSNNGDAAGQWALPGGKIKDGETPHAAAARESYEETGHYPKLVKQLHTTDDTSPVHFTTFLAPTQKFTPQLNGEHTAHKWVTPEDARDMNLHPGVRSMLDHMMATDGWNEQEHPRGQPDNAGEFASKGELASSGEQDAGKQQDMFEKDFTTNRTRGNRNSAGHPIASTVQGLHNFKKWFGGSKAVDDKGRPMVMYHSTAGDFNQFEANRPTKNTGLFGVPFDAQRAGIFFTPDEKFSEGYSSEKEGQNIMPVYLRLEDPVDLRKGLSEALENTLEANGYNTRMMNQVQYDWELFDHEYGGKEFVEALKKAGYDGAIMNEQDEDGNEHVTYVAFDPDQIKSAIGNKGAFSTKSSVITDSALGEDAGEWDESKHPRGQPGNAGEFASAPGTGGKEQDEYKGPDYTKLKTTDTGQIRVETNSGKHIGTYSSVEKAHEVSRLEDKRLLDEHLKKQKESQHPERKRIQTSMRVPRKVLFEVAPDPHDKELSGRWNKLDANTRTQISSKVLNDVLPEVLKKVGGGKPVKADMHLQYGGYLDDTNPSMSLVLGKGVSDEQADMLTRALGAILSQDSMARVSKKPFKDSFEMGVVSVSVPKNINFKQVSELYSTLREKVKGEGGKDIINGHTTDAGHMMILVDKGTEADIAKQVDEALGGKHDIGYDVVNVAWPEKGEDNYGFTGESKHRGSGTGSSIQPWIDSVHAQASRDLSKYIESEG